MIQLARTHLSFDSIATLFTQIHEIEDSTLQMSQRRNTLHLNRVHILQRVIQDTGRIDDLPSKVFIIQMSHKEGFCGKSVGLDVNVGPSDFVDE